MVSQARQPRGRSDGGQFKGMDGNSGNGGMPPTGMTREQEDYVTASRILDANNPYNVRQEDMGQAFDCLTAEKEPGYLWKPDGVRHDPETGLAMLAIMELDRTEQGRNTLLRDGIDVHALNQADMGEARRRADRVRRKLLARDSPITHPSDIIAYDMDDERHATRVSDMVFQRMAHPDLRRPDPLPPVHGDSLRACADSARYLANRRDGYRQAAKDYDRSMAGLESQLAGLDTLDADTRHQVATDVADSVSGETDMQGESQYYRNQLMYRLCREAEHSTPYGGWANEDDMVSQSQSPTVLKALRRAGVTPRTAGQVRRWVTTRQPVGVSGPVPAPDDSEGRVKPDLSDLW